MSTPTPDMSRYEELLAARAIGDIDAPEAQDLERLQAALGEDESFDEIAAAIDLALTDEPHEAPPANVMAQLRAAARSFESERTGEPVVAKIGGDAPATGLGSLGWLAAAACLLLALLAWIPLGSSSEGDASPSFAQVAEAPAALTVGLSADLAGEQPIGQLVWDAETQRGVMRFEGLAVNDPGVEQYQLWIFDASRESFSESPLEIRHPVDGGVFDIGEDGVVEVPIDAKVPVGQPVLFAVTIEPPGGVVVSDRSRIAAVGIPG